MRWLIKPQWYYSVVNWILDLRSSQLNCWNQKVGPHFFWNQNKIYQYAWCSICKYGKIHSCWSIFWLSLINQFMYVFHKYIGLHMPVGTAIEWAIVRRFPKPIASECQFRIRNKVLVNRLTTTSPHDQKDFIMENVGELDVDCPDKSHAWRLRVNRYNLSDFVCSIQQMLWEFQAIFLQLTTFPTKIYAQT